MPTTNDVTGDRLISKEASDKYREGWETIFGKKKEAEKSASLHLEDEKDEPTTATD